MCSDYFFLSQEFSSFASPFFFKKINKNLVPGKKILAVRKKSFGSTVHQEKKILAPEKTFLPDVKQVVTNLKGQYPKGRLCSSGEMPFDSFTKCE